MGTGGACLRNQLARILNPIDYPGADHAEVRRAMSAAETTSYKETTSYIVPLIMLAVGLALIAVALWL